MSDGDVLNNDRKMTSVFEKFLSLWVALCIIAGILLVIYTLALNAYATTGLNAVWVGIGLCDHVSYATAQFEVQQAPRRVVVAAADSTAGTSHWPIGAGGLCFADDRFVRGRASAATGGRALLAGCQGILCLNPK